MVFFLAGDHRRFPHSSGALFARCAWRGELFGLQVQRPVGDERTITARKIALVMVVPKPSPPSLRRLRQQIAHRCSEWAREDVRDPERQHAVDVEPEVRECRQRDQRGEHERGEHEGGDCVAGDQVLGNEVGGGLPSANVNSIAPSRTARGASSRSSGRRLRPHKDCRVRSLWTRYFGSVAGSSAVTSIVGATGNSTFSSSGAMSPGGMMASVGTVMYDVVPSPVATRRPNAAF